MKAKDLNNSLWILNDDMIHVSKKGRGYYVIGNKFDFEAKNAKEAIAKLKKMGYEHIGYEDRNTFSEAEPIAIDVPKVEEVKEPEMMIVERAMSVKNPTVKKYLAEGWEWGGKEWNAEKNMYLATLIKSGGKTA